MKRHQPVGASAASAWLIGIALGISLISFLGCLAGAQLTTEGTGLRLLRRATVEITDLDGIMPSLTLGVHEAAADGAGSDITVPGYPIVLVVPQSQAAKISEEDLRAIIVDISARKMYADGMSVWTESDPESLQSIERFSTAGAVKYGLGLIRDSNHRLFRIAAIFFGGLSAVMAVLLLIVVRGAYMRMVALGSAIVVAALPSLAAAVGVRFAFKTEDSDDPFTEGMLDIGADAMLVPIQDCLLLTLLGIAIAATGAGLLWWSSRRSEPPRTLEAPTGV